jgi:hypothetical protein
MWDDKRIPGEHRGFEQRDCIAKEGSKLDFPCEVLRSAGNIREVDKWARDPPEKDPDARWGVGKHLGSKIKSRRLQQINFFTSSRRDWHFENPSANSQSGSPAVCLCFSCLNEGAAAESVLHPLKGE